MAQISVTEIDGSTFSVVVDEGSSSTEHRVEVAPQDLEAIPDPVSAAELVEASFRFLLDREPKESILSRFELSVISRYFPEYRDEIRGYL